ncbi:MAG: hypothetical protein APF84_18850 [Gracilibacter sp. BRH_c7a]|nr:MAG: hypothetical protein APF84_18850 [Gracilibacter sp. BRH_c7a]
MKYVRFQKADKTIKSGIVEGNSIKTVEGNIFGEHKVTDESYNLDDVKLLSPVEPSKLLCIGLNYSDHAKEFGKPIPEEPMLFLKPPTCVIGPEDNIMYPSQTQNLHYEVELVIVIGKEAKNVSEEKAFDYVFGYTVGNDVTARDIQFRDNQWGRAKGFDTFAPLGPWIETEIKDPDSLDVKLLLNGEVKQSSNTSNLFFKCANLISYLSGIMTLLPGDVIMTGTPGGIGPMQVGDKVEAIVDGIGTLKNYIAK